MKESEASATALRVLQGVVYTATRESTSHIVSTPARETAIRLMSRFPLGARRLKSLKGPGRKLIPVLETLLLPGISLHYALRKRWIEERTRSAVEAGARQVINLGAGMDTLALRLASEFPEVKFIEIDHPASQRLKAQLLVEESPGDNLELLSVDFSRETLAKRLPEARLFDGSLSALVICEGVLAYLDRQDVKRLFRSVHELMGSGTRMLFTYLAPESPSGRKPFGPLLKVYLAFASESLRFQIRPEDLPALLKEEHFLLEETALGPDLLEEYDAPQYRGPVHDLEIMALATAQEIQ